MFIFCLGKNLSNSIFFIYIYLNGGTCPRQPPHTPYSCPILRLANTARHTTDTRTITLQSATCFHYHHASDGCLCSGCPSRFLTKRILTLGHQRPQSSMTWHSRAVFPNSLLLTKQWKATNCEPCCATLLYQQKAERGLTAKKGHPLGFRPPSLMQSAQLGGRNPRFRPD